MFKNIISMDILTLINDTIITILVYDHLKNDN